ncbi:MAG: hypothetical protein KL839_04885 [Rhizobium sp.]|nr:hypothetical protein [Rhizobium sp.]
MSNSSSTLDSKESSEVLPGAGGFLRRCRAFLAPLLLLLPFGFPILLSGEFVPAWMVARAQKAGIPLLVLQRYSDHNFSLKVSAANAQRPEVLVLGSSRTNQWRSKHFYPYTFYNAGNISARINDLQAVLDRLTYDPRVIIFSLDFFMFSDRWAPHAENVAKNDIVFPSEAAYILRKLLRDITFGSAPYFPTLREPIYGQMAVGLQAAQLGNGFRSDGSYQYGAVYSGKADGIVTPERAFERIELGKQPFMFGDSSDPGQKVAFLNFVNEAKSRGINLVALTTAYQPPVVEAMASSPRHGLWREFRSTEFQSWIKHAGVLAFDFTDTASFNGSEDEFIDSFHPSEPAFSKQLLTMWTRKEFSDLLPRLEPEKVAAALQSATRYEVYRNEF